MTLVTLLLFVLFHVLFLYAISNLTHISGLAIECVFCFGMKSVDYDKEGSVLRVRGKNITENEHVKVSDIYLIILVWNYPVKMTSFFLNEDWPVSYFRARAEETFCSTKGMI